MDPMYAQRLFYPVHTVLRILPSIKPCPDSQEFDKASKDPALILRSSINSYLLHAQTPYQLSVYRVELWKNEVSYTALTMTQWLEVGFPASVHDLPAILAQKKSKSIVFLNEIIISMDEVIRKIVIFVIRLIELNLIVRKLRSMKVIRHIISERRKSVKTKDLKLSSADLSFVPPQLYLKLEMVRDKNSNHYLCPHSISPPVPII
jgi:hypothetical protein